MKKKKVGKLRRVMRWTVVVLCACAALSFALVVPLRWINPTTSSFMLRDDSGRQPVLYQWASWNEIGIAPALAVVAAEDQRFAEHFGMDFHSMRDAMRSNAEGRPVKGASTITQQLAKNLFLWSGRNYVRKGLEAWFAVLLEISLPKKRILEIYLNVVELGPGVYGFPAGSRYYFRKDSSRMSDSEAALLTAVLPNPHLLQADRPSEYVRNRQRWIVGQMQRLRREQWIRHLD